MALSPDDLAQIREVVQTEIQQKPRSGPSAGKIIGLILLIIVGLFLAVLALHILVIAGFTIWHLLHPSP